MSSQQQRIMAIFIVHKYAHLDIKTLAMLTKMKRKTVDGRVSELIKKGRLIRVKRGIYKLNQEYKGEPL